MKNCFFVFLLGICFFSCAKPAVIINLDEFDGSYEKAFMSRFQTKNDKIYLTRASSAFDGKLSFVELNKFVREMTIEDGEIKKLLVHDSSKNLVAEGKREGNSFRINRKMQTYNSTFNHGEFILTNFSNKDFATKPVEEQEGSGILKGDKGIEGTVKVSINSRKNLIITESVKKQYKTIIEESISYVKRLNDSTHIELIMEELLDVKNETDYLPYMNEYTEVYTETVNVRYPKSSLKMKSAWSVRDDLRLISEQGDFIAKNCNVSEVLVSGISPLAIDESECVSDGLKYMNELLKKRISRETLKNRILAKQKNNKFLSREPQDIDFYF